MKFEKPLKICIGCQTKLTNERVAEMIYDALLDDNFIPKEFQPGSTLKISINLEFSIPDYDI